jgi:hypothetical protein
MFASVSSVYSIYGEAPENKICNAMQEVIINFGNFLHPNPYCAGFLIFISVSTAFVHKLQ